MLWLALAVSVLPMLVSCREPAYRLCSGAAWGTTYHVTYCSDKPLDDSIMQVVRQVDLTLSPFRSQSVLSRINRGDTLDAHPWIERVMELSQYACSISGGAFDPTLAPLINLWGFGYEQGSERVPTQQQIDSVLATVGIMQCGVINGKVVKKHSDTQFNFSAIAKGYGVDMIAEMLSRNGCDNYLVEVGGELSMRGLNARGEEWHVQIDAPVPSDSSAALHQRLMLVTLTDTCMATSGNYRNYREVDGRRYGHTISPVTGMPVATTTLSATVTAGSCALADALATACMAMPVDSARAMIDALTGVGAWLVVAEADTFKIISMASAKAPTYNID